MYEQSHSVLVCLAYLSVTMHRMGDGKREKLGVDGIYVLLDSCRTFAYILMETTRVPGKAELERDSAGVYKSCYDQEA